MNYTILLSLLLGVSLVSSAFAAQINCDLCDEPVEEASAVVVTDWQTNENFTFRCIACAAIMMRQDHPWSRAVFKSETGRTLKLTYADGQWSSDPEGAVVAIRTVNGDMTFHSFASLSELSVFSRKQGDFSRTITKTFPLSRIVDELLSLDCLDRGGQSVHELSNLPIDVPPDHWASGAVENVIERGLMKGDPDGKFRGKDALTRYEAAVMLDRLSRNDTIDMAPPVSTGRGKPTAPTAAQPLVRSPGLSEREISDVNFFGQSGLMTIPNSDTLGSRDFSAGYAAFSDSSLVHGTLGLGAEGRLEAGFAVTGGDLPSAVTLNAKYSLPQEGPWGSRMAVGLLDLSNEIGISLYGALSRGIITRFAGRIRAVQLTAGLGSGDLLGGPFFGARTSLNDNTSLMLEWADVANQRSINLGVGHRLFKGTEMKLGIVDDQIAGSVGLSGKF